MGRSPTEPTSASPVLHSFSLNLAAVQSTAANRSLSLFLLSQQRGPLQGTPGLSCRSVYTRLLVLPCSGALLRGDGREGRPALFYLVTTAVRAGGLFRVMLCYGQNLREGLLAGVAEELIVGHTDLPQS
jgi:hypothetical protein